MASSSSFISRMRFIQGLIVFVFGAFVIGAFYTQIIRHDYYQNRAKSTQLKQYEIPATRGIISALGSDGKPVPIVLSQTLYTIYGDPSLIKNAPSVAKLLAADLNLQPDELQQQLETEGTRYVVLKKKVSQEVKNKVLAHKLAGIGAQDRSYRLYPQGNLAAQLLGIVNDDGDGRYGVEQALNDKLAGQAGLLKAVTDINGVPLATSKDNVSITPIPGDNVILNIDLGMQQQLQKILAQRAKSTKTELASALIVDANSGAVKAMANYPSYNPSDLSKIDDAAVLNNAAVSHPIEVGSIMKALTTAAALDDKVVTNKTSYNDPSFYKVDGFTIRNVEEDGGPGQKDLYDLLNLSLNTGATWLLMQMGGGQINATARGVWHSYLTDHFMLGRATGIEQGYEEAGFIPSPDDNGQGINLTYANTAFGQAMTATPLQMASALAATVNGGVYYQPQLVKATVDANGVQTNKEPKVISRSVVRPDVSKDLIDMLIYSVDHHPFVPGFDQSRYMVGGKTGTAQLALPSGGYSEHDFNGTYLGFVGGDKPQYVICVFMIKPKVDYYAGTAAALPVFGDLAHMLINNSYVSPKD